MRILNKEEVQNVSGGFSVGDFMNLGNSILNSINNIFNSDPVKGTVSDNTIGAVNGIFGAIWGTIGSIWAGVEGIINSVKGIK